MHTEQQVLRDKMASWPDEAMEKIVYGWADCYARELKLSYGEQIAYRAGAHQMLKHCRIENSELRRKILDLATHILTSEEEKRLHREFDELLETSYRNRKRYREIPRFKRKFTYWCGYYMGVRAFWRAVKPFVRSYSNKINI